MPSAVALCQFRNTIYSSVLLAKEDISIGVTVFRRLDFLEQALASAVGQTVPVRVLLYDDGCEDLPALRAILSQFGSRVEYRGPEGAAGLFRNMNRCIWNSPTPWVSVLHDDDLLEADFVERLLAVAPEVGSCALFCGGTTYIDREGRPFFVKSPAAGSSWRPIALERLAVENQFSFPGQLIHVATARAVGGFPEKSLYTGDWELWFKLTQAGGGVQLGANLSRYRSHEGEDRGTTAANRSGRKLPGCAVQVKRNLARLRSHANPALFDRRVWVRIYRPLYRDLLPNARMMSARLLGYNRRLLLLNPPASKMARALHLTSCVFGNFGIRCASLVCNLLVRAGARAPQRF